jgi:uncharacterized membrane protein (UPF0182 family)
VPELELVLVVNGSTVTLGRSLTEAIEESTGAVTGEEPQPPDGGEGTVEQQIERLLSQAVTHFAAADEALRAGDLATYQSEQERAQALVEQANELLAAGAGGEPSPSPSP